MKRTRRGLLALAAGGALTMGVWGAMTAFAAPSGNVALPKDATLTDLVRTLHESQKRLVLAEVSTVPRTLEKALPPTPLVEALPTLAPRFSFHATVRPEGIVLQRAYGDAKEEPNLEPELMAAVSADIYRLAHAFAPITFVEEDIRNQNRFAKSFSDEQKQKLAADGLPISELRPEQAKMWERINKAQGYADLYMTSRRAERMFGTINDGVMAFRTLPTQVEGGKIIDQTSLWYEYPDADPENEKGLARWYLQRDFSEPRPDAEQKEFEYSYRNPTPAGRPAVFRKPIHLANGEVTLGDLAHAIEAASDVKLAIPTYAQKRKLLAYADGAQAVDLMEGLIDLYGWELSSVGEKQYRLDRPVLTPAKDAEEFHQKVRAAIPPMVHLLWRDRNRVYSAVADRQARIMYAAMAAAAKIKGEDWKEVRMTELPDRERLRFLNMLFETYLYGAALRFSENETERPCLVSPETGTFQMKPPMRAEYAPMLMFRVKGPDGKMDEWGWAVGTSSLKDE